MSDTFVTSSNFTDAVVQLWANTALQMLKPNMVMAGLVNTTYSDDPGNVGQSVTVTYPAKDITSTVNLSEGGQIELDADNINTSTITVNQHTTKAFAVPVATQSLLNIDLAQLYLKQYIPAVTRTIESYLLGLYSGFTTTPYGTAGTQLGQTDLNLIETALFDSEAYGDYNLIVDGGNYANLRNQTNLSTAYAFGANDQLHTGSPDGFKAFNMNIKRSQLVHTISGGFAGVAFSKDAIGLVTRKMIDLGPGAVSATAEEDGFSIRVTQFANGPKMAQQFVIDVLWGAAVLRPDLGIEVKC